MQRTAIVTGGTRGIGAAIAIALQGAGFRVGVNYCGNEEVARRFTGETGIPGFRWDVGDYAACADGLAAFTQAIGPVDVLVNNAGITRDAMFHKMTPEQWNAVIGTNLTGVFNMCRLVWDGMRERGFGRIVNISSINGQKGQVGQVNYSAAKAGDIGLTKALAQEGARKGITVNAICPGYIATEMVASIPDEVMERQILPQIPVGRLGAPDEIARAVLFLAAEDAGYVTGATMTINGGQYLA